MLYKNTTTTPSNANNAELATNRPAPFVEEGPPAVPVLDPLLPVAFEPDACGGSVVRDPAGIDDIAEVAPTEAVLPP